MISFKSFINAIHQAVLAANSELMDKNTALLDKYFYVSDNESELQSALDEALKASNNIANKSGTVTQEDFKTASEALAKAKKALSADEPSPNNNSATIPGTLTAKSVIVEYPHQTTNGIQLTPVHVPLITLVPLSMSQIEKAVITANFDMSIVKNELQLDFTDNSDNFWKKSKKRGKLEITISPQETSEGLKELVAGYERALKMQIPH